MPTPIPNDPALAAALAFHEMLRRLDVPAAEIFVGANPVDSKVQVHVHVRRGLASGNCKDGDCRLIIDAGKTDDPATFDDRWEALVTQFNQGDYDKAEFQRLYKRTLAASGGAVPLVTLAMARRIGRYSERGLLQ